ncbi:MAG: PilZ domain-containing protein [Acidobacteriota bacterium]
MDSERRQSKRGDLFTEVEYEGGGIRAETRISDISLSGVFIDALSPLPVGAALKVTFTLPGGERVVTEGVVVHSQPSIGMGVSFTSLKPEDARRIQEALDAQQ